MLKPTCFILLFISTFSLSAQRVKILISGTIKSDEKVLKDIHIINKSSRQGIITNSEGQFSIRVKDKDTLVFRGIQFERKEIIITKADLDNRSIQVYLATRTNILEEVHIKKAENMAVGLNLPNAGKTPLKGVDLKLAYYSQESTPIVILKALFLSEQGGIDNIYNIISGNRKKHRKLKKLIEEDKLLEYNKKVFLQIRKHFKDEFFINTIKISSNKIDKFIESCAPKNIISLFNNENYLEIIDVFVKQSKPFLKDLKYEE